MKKYILLSIIAVFSLTLTACTLPGCLKSHNVTFDPDNGAAIENITVKDGQTVARPADPVKEGSDFLYWALNGDEFDFENPITADIVLRAAYGKRMNVTLDFDNGTPAAVVQVKEGEKVGKPVDPEKEGYVFLAWMLNGAEYDFDTPVTADITLTAAYGKTYTVILDADNGTEKVTAVVNEGTVYAKPADPVKDGFIFKGWTVGGKAYDFTAPVTSDLEIKASWEKYVAETGVKLSSASLLLARGKDATLTATVSPSNATNKGVTFTSSDASVVSVDKNGKIKALKKGTAKITATTANGKTAVTTVEVFVPVESITLTVDHSVIAYGGNAVAKITATVSPADADITEVSWNAANISSNKETFCRFAAVPHQNVATLTALAGSRSHNHPKISASITNADGSVIESAIPDIYCEPALTVTAGISPKDERLSKSTASEWYYPSLGAITLETNVEVTFTFTCNHPYEFAQEFVNPTMFMGTMAKNDSKGMDVLTLTVTSAGGQEKQFEIYVMPEDY